MFLCFLPPSFSRTVVKKNLSLCRVFTAAMWCVPALRVPLVHSLINRFRQNYFCHPVATLWNTRTDRSINFSKRYSLWSPYNVISKAQRRFLPQFLFEKGTALQLLIETLPARHMHS